MLLDLMAVRIKATATEVKGSVTAKVGLIAGARVRDLIRALLRRCSLPR